MSMIGGAGGSVQAKIAELRTRVQQQTASLRGRIPGLGRAGSGEALQTIGDGTIVKRVQSTVRGILPGGGKEISFKDGNPLGPLGVGGAGGLQLLKSGGILSTIRTKGVLGTLTGGGLMQTLSGGGYRPAPGVRMPGTERTAPVGPEGYRKFV